MKGGTSAAEGTPAIARMPAKQANQREQEWEQGEKSAAKGTPAIAGMPASSGKPTEAGVGAGRDATGRWSTRNSRDASIIRKANRSRSGSREGRHR
jgi:hypothetical protein